LRTRNPTRPSPTSGSLRSGAAARPDDDSGARREPGADDRAIDESRQALETDPASTYVSRHLMQTRRAKLDLLRHAAALTTDFN
jgi:hypothetical protein